MLLFFNFMLYFMCMMWMFLDINQSLYQSGISLLLKFLMYVFAAFNF